MNLTEWRSKSPLLVDLDDNEYEYLSGIATERRLSEEDRKSVV